VKNIEKLKDNGNLKTTLTVCDKKVQSSFCLEEDKSFSDGSLKSREWLNTEQAADYLSLTVGALRNMTSNGQIPYHKLGNRNRYSVIELRQLLLSNKRGVRHGN
jgi:excisionase family DNA binding protein